MNPTDRYETTSLVSGRFLLPIWRQRLIPDSYKGRDYLRLLGCYSNKHSFWYDLKGVR